MSVTMTMFQRPIFSLTITRNRSISCISMFIVFLLCYCYALDIKKAHGQRLVDKEAGVPQRLTAHQSSTKQIASVWAGRSTEPKAPNFLLTCLPPVPWLDCHFRKKSWLYVYIRLSLGSPPRLPLCSPLQWPEGQVLRYALSFSLWLQLMQNMFHGLHLAFNRNVKIRTKSPLPYKRNALLQTQLPCSGHQSVILGLSSF